MKTSSSLHPHHHFPSTKFYTSITTRVYIRTQLSFPAKVFLCQAKSGTNGSLNVRVMPPTLLAAEKEEAKAVLMLFLKKEGLSNAIAARTVNKSDPFIDHLVSVLHSKHKSRYLGENLQHLKSGMLLSHTLNLFSKSTVIV
ncbi:hypothetical protein AAHE18_20G247500 [Arachis hypogaea]